MGCCPRGHAGPKLGAGGPGRPQGAFGQGWDLVCSCPRGELPPSALLAVDAPATCCWTGPGFLGLSAQVWSGAPRVPRDCPCWDLAPFSALSTVLKLGHWVGGCVKAWPRFQSKPPSCQLSIHPSVHLTGCLSTDVWLLRAAGEAELSEAQPPRGEWCLGSDGLAWTPALPLTECPLGPGFLTLCKVCLGRSPIVRVEPKLTGVSYSCARSGGGDGVRVVVKDVWKQRGHRSSDSMLPWCSVGWALRIGS